MRIVVVMVLVAIISPAQAQVLGTWCNPVLGCIQVTCEMARTYGHLVTQAQIDAATPQQRAAARACLGLPAEFKSPRGKRAMRKATLPP